MCVLSVCVCLLGACVCVYRGVYNTKFICVMRELSAHFKASCHTALGGRRNRHCHNGGCRVSEGGGGDVGRFDKLA